MDQRRARRDQLETPGRDFAELAGNHDQRVGARDQIIGNARVAAEQAGGERVRARDRALAGHRVRDRNAEAFREREQRVIAFRDVDAAADQQQRPLGLRDDLRGALDLGRVGARAARLRLQRTLVDPEIRGVEIVLAVADVFRHVEHDRPRPPRSSRPRRRGAAARECAWSPRRGSAPSRRGAGFPPAAPPASCSSRRDRGWHRR